MDGDVFERASNLARAAGDTLVAALRGQVWNPFLSAKTLDRVIGAARGIPSLPGVLQEIEALGSAPLLARADETRERAVERVEALCRAPGGLLDLLLMRVVQASILRGEFDCQGMVATFVQRVFDRAVLCSRRGCVERVAPGERKRMLALLQPIVMEAAQVLVANPERKRLGLAAKFGGSIGPGSNLLGDDR